MNCFDFRQRCKRRCGTRRSCASATDACGIFPVYSQGRFAGTDCGSEACGHGPRPRPAGSRQSLGHFRPLLTSLFLCHVYCDVGVRGLAPGGSSESRAPRARGTSTRQPRQPRQPQPRQPRQPRTHAMQVLQRSTAHKRLEAAMDAGDGLQDFPTSRHEIAHKTNPRELVGKNAVRRRHIVFIVDVGALQGNQT